MIYDHFSNCPHKNDERTLTQLLEVENDEALLNALCPQTRIPVWAIARNQFFRFIMSDLLYATHPLLSIDQPIPKARIVTAIGRSIFHNLRNPPRRSRVLVRTTGAGLMKKDGASFNRYTGFFSSAVNGGTWSIEDLASWTWPALPQRTVTYTTAKSACIRIKSRLRMNGETLSLARETVHRAVSRAEHLLGWTPGADRLAWLEAYTARRLASLPLQYAAMNRWLDRIRPALFMVEEGCYGQMAAFNAATRDRGILVAEFQHGVVTAGHDVYNVSPVLAESSSYRRTLPDVFLGYGSWWNQQFSQPVEKVVIGNPYRNEILGHLKPQQTGLKQILVLGDGRELQAHLDLCRDISMRLPSSWQVLFRPHPEERRTVFSMSPAAFSGFGLDRENDIYVSLAHAEAVIAELSTGLFDGIGLARRILAWDTPKGRFALPSHPFARFSNTETLIKSLLAPQAGELSDEQIEGIWANNWRERFEQFLNTYVTGT